MTPKADRIYLEHILDCVALIQNYTREGKAEFMASALVQDAMLRRLQTMAESTQRLSEELKAKVPGMDWRALAGFRNVLVHDYLGGIDLEQIWNAVEHYLPSLETAMRELMEWGNVIAALPCRYRKGRPLGISPKSQRSHIQPQFLRITGLINQSLNQ